MILILEIAFLITGVYAVATGKMPALIVGKGYKAEGKQVRRLGVLMAITLPAVLLGTFVAGALGGISGTGGLIGVAVFELVWVIGVAIAVSAGLRKIRQPISKK